jgi:hypothetical protein
VKGIRVCAIALLSIGSALAVTEDAPVPVDVVTREDLAVRTDADLVKIIPQIPAVAARTPRGVAIGDGRGDRVVIDGVVIDETEPPLAGLPSDLIDKIEVLRGPSDAIYGDDAIGGVVQVATDSKVWCKYVTGIPVPYVPKFLGGVGDEDDEGEDGGEDDPYGEYLEDLDEAATHGECGNGEQPPGDWVKDQAPAVAGAPAQRASLEKQWNDLATQQQALEQTRDTLTTELEKAKDDENAAEIARLEKALADLSESQDKVAAAAGAVGEELEALEQAEAAKQDDLRSRLWTEVNRIAGPKIESRISTAETVQGVKETVTTGTQWISTGSTAQKMTAKTTRMGNRESIAAEEKIAAVDTLLADPARTADETAMLGKIREVLVLKGAAADELLSSNGWITTAGYGTDVVTTVCGAKLVQLGKNLVGRLFARTVAKETTETVVTQTVAREAGESGSTTSVTRAMEKPPIDMRTLGDSQVRTAMEGVKKLADEKHAGDVWPALQETLDNVLGKDILPTPKTAGSEAARESLEAGWKTARSAIQSSGANAAGQAGERGGTTILKDVWKGFTSSGADPNGMTTIFGVTPIVMLFGLQQQGYAQDPIYGAERSDGTFTFSVFSNTDTTVRTPVYVDAPLEQPLDSILLDPQLQQDRPTGTARFVTIGGQSYLVLHRETEPPHDDATPNNCRDKQLVPPIDWTDAAAALPAPTAEHELPATAVRLAR